MNVCLLEEYIKPKSSTITSRMLGSFRDNAETRAEFMNLINAPKQF